MVDTVFKAVDGGRITLDSCAAPLDAALAAFMLGHLPLGSLHALRGTCHALKDMVDGAPPAVLMAAFRTARLLPPAIADHLSSIEAWKAALYRHKAVLGRLRSGACTHMKQQPLGADQVARTLSWSPSAQPHLAFAARTRLDTNLVPDQLHVLNARTFEPLSNAVDLPEGLEVMRLEWISDRYLLCKVWDDGPATAILDTFSGVFTSRLDNVIGSLSPDKRDVLAWHVNGKIGVHQLPALQLRYLVALPQAAKPGSAKFIASAAQWSMTGAHVAVCWKLDDPRVPPLHFCLMTVHNAVDGSIVRTYKIHDYCGSSLPVLSWSPALESILLHGDGNCVVISQLKSPEPIGRYLQVGWSPCGGFIHGLQALDQHDDSDLCSCHIWNALTHEQVFAWQQRRAVTHPQTQSIVWAHDAPVCFVPEKQMVVLMPSFHRLGGKTCRTLLLTRADGIPLPAPQPNHGWSLSACGRLLVNSGQGQHTSQGQLPYPSHTQPQVTVPSPHRQAAIQAEALFSSVSDVSSAPAAQGPLNGPSGHQPTTMAWHPTPSNSRMYAACNHAGDVCLVDGCAARAVCVWPRDQLAPADLAVPPGVGPADLYWSPNGETLVVSRQGCMTFLHFGPAI